MTPLEFLTNLYAHCEPGWLSLFTIDRSTGTNRVHWYRTDELERIVAEIDPKRCTWFGVATRRERITTDDGSTPRGGHDDCVQVPALYLDVDVHDPVRHKLTEPKPGRTPKVLPPDRDAARLLLADHPIAPTYIVDTGGGLQAWYVLSEPLDVASGEAQRTLDAWRDTWATLAGERRGWHLDNVHDVPRIMRLPGTRNTKSATP